MALRTYGVETHGSRVTLHDVASLKAYVGLSDGVRPEVLGVREPVEKVLSDAFRLRRREKRR
jgi:hypothetical protein